MYDSSWSNSDNITFIPGVSIKGDVPNPMTFIVPANVSDQLYISRSMYMNFSLLLEYCTFICCGH